jgi:hypothetical protein
VEAQEACHVYLAIAVCRNSFGDEPLYHGFPGENSSSKLGRPLNFSNT